MRNQFVLSFFFFWAGNFVFAVIFSEYSIIVIFITTYIYIYVHGKMLIIIIL